MKGIQILGILISVYLMIQTLIQYRKKSYSLRKTISWIILWTLMGIIFTYPSLVGLVLPIFTMQDAMLATTVMGLIVVYVLVYHTYQQTTEIEKKLTELVQNIAITDYIKEVGNDPGKKDEQ